MGVFTAHVVGVHEVAEFIEGQSRADEEALHLVAAERTQLGQLLAVLDPFGHHLQVQAVAQLDHRGDQLSIGAGFGNTLDETAIDFQQIDG